MHFCSGFSYLTEWFVMSLSIKRIHWNILTTHKFLIIIYCFQNSQFFFTFVEIALVSSNTSNILIFSSIVSMQQCSFYFILWIVCVCSLLNSGSMDIFGWHYTLASYILHPTNTFTARCLLLSLTFLIYICHICITLLIVLLIYIASLCFPCHYLMVFLEKVYYFNTSSWI